MKKLCCFYIVAILFISNSRAQDKYPGVNIGNQTWMVKNLDVTTYKNGDLIQYVTDPAAWAALTKGAWCYHENVAANGTVYGKLYNWYAVNDPRGLAPAGYHIASDAEWTTLSTGLGGDSVAGAALKETGTTHWRTPNTGPTKINAFTGLPGGLRDLNGGFSNFGANGLFWSSSELVSSSVAWYRSLNYNFGKIYRSEYNKHFGFSVRCIKDSSSKTNVQLKNPSIKTNVKQK